MFIIGFLVVGGIGVGLYHWFNRRNSGTNTPLLREYYGCLAEETLVSVWPNGLRWLRRNDTPGPDGSADAAVGWLPAFWTASPYDTLALSLTADGVFILVDNRRDNNIGVIRFSLQDIRAVTRLSSRNELTASRLGWQETAISVELYLKTGQSYWIQLPKSAHQALTQPELSDKS